MAALNVFQISCPTDCATALTMPALPEDMCQKAQVDAEIDMLLFQGSADGPTDASSAVAWTSGMIDNTDTTGTDFHYLIGSGTIAAAEATIQTGARGAESVIRRTYTLVFDVFDISEPETYDFLRTLECGSTLPRLMYTSRGGWLYCKVGASTATDNGITIKSLQVDFIKEKDAGDKATLTIKWDAKTNPDRVTNPLTL